MTAVMVEMRGIRTHDTATTERTLNKHGYGGTDRSTVAKAELNHTW